MRIKGKVIFPGVAEGEILVSSEAVSFLGGVDPASGLVKEKGHPLEGNSLKDKILLLPGGKGSTVGSYVLYQMKKNGTAPAGIFSQGGDEMIASGAIISEIPMLFEPKGELLSLSSGKMAVLNAREGYIEVKY